jgi:hypothetical protein
MANLEHVKILMKQGVDAWNRWRIDNQDLSPDFEGENLSYEVLKGANLCKSKLNEANLKGTDLREANLSGAELLWADFRWANLEGADLSGAILHLASLNDVIFKDVNLSGTHFGATIIGNSNFSGAIGLEVVKHDAPSIIGLDTIYKSKGEIPEVFLRGCGVPEEFITHMKSLPMNPNKYFSCFISYSHEDKLFARRLHDQLQARGIRCWLDEHQLLPGDDMHDMIDRGISLWDKVLLCCSEAALNSWWVDKELDRAIKKEERLWKERGKKVLALIPLNLDNYMFNEWESGKKDMVTNRLAADFTGWETDNSKFEKQFEWVVKALQTEGAREEAPESRL